MASSPAPELPSLPAKPLIARWQIGAGLLLAWLLCCAVMLWLARNSLPTLDFRDPDDAMRLQQVRDWLHGQGFWDVSQHRVNPPVGGPMHWSRIVDMPIAALILLLRPLFGAATAELAACALVPLLTLGALTGTLFLAARRATGSGITALLAVTLLLTTPTILVQFTPLRIDHHGWQIWMAALALCGSLDRHRSRGGITAGLALAVWLQISSEALPYAALFAGAFALRYWLDAREGVRLRAFAVTLGGGALALLLVLRGLQAPLIRQCDSLSAAYVWPLLAFTLATPLALRLFGSGSTRRRFLATAAAGLSAAGLFLLTGGACLSGDPFKALGPVAYRLWYLQVKEGRPVWEQGLLMGGIILLPAIMGLIGTIVAARTAKDREARDGWIVITLLLGGALAVAILVLRAMSVAHVLALPGIAWLLLTMFQHIQTWSRAAVRIVVTAAVALLLTPAGLCGAWILIASGAAEKEQPETVNCRASAILAPLRALPKATLFAPLDLGPDILVRTGHSVIGTAHHRNAAGITAVIAGFTATPDKAQAIVMGLNGGKGADYVLICHELNEVKHYRADFPHGLAAALERNKTPRWLRPIPGKGPLRIYKVVAQPGAKVSATPFMQ
ncbi:hypothetical protein [Sphingobium chlorophenolicum]|uniref:Uncharacterized protein n=1 Tax=Sphingobium chlorophenolicum TaxID=46429 RepID=A0A081RCQ6_SPHCR|nr:hypothetical protein [Sphingobium chlorophenolicum]KEQ52979.1 hypothetical protein BV95_02770 [Sphingobium chlorophenolicum]